VCRVTKHRQGGLQATFDVRNKRLACSTSASYRHTPTNNAASAWRKGAAGAQADAELGLTARDGRHPAPTTHACGLTGHTAAVPRLDVRLLLLEAVAACWPCEHHHYGGRTGLVCAPGHAGMGATCRSMMMAYVWRVHLLLPIFASTAGAMVQGGGRGARMMVRRAGEGASSDHQESVWQHPPNHDGQGAQERWEGFKGWGEEDHRSRRWGIFGGSPATSSWLHCTPRCRHAQKCPDWALARLGEPEVC
jgi:hypothetical protein